MIGKERGKISKARDWIGQNFLLSLFFENFLAHEHENQSEQSTAQLVAFRIELYNTIYKQIFFILTLILLSKIYVPCSKTSSQMQLEA